MSAFKSINLPGFGQKMKGKVREFYDIGDRRVLITTDRISAFDRVLGAVEFKGQVLNQLAAFWFEQTKDIVANQVISVVDPNVTIAKKCQTYPIEIIVRGYISGSTKTSLWSNYDKGEREIYGVKFPNGLKKNQKLPQPVITPTTRATGSGGHDEKISKKEIIARNIISKEKYEEIENAALELFKRGTKICAKAGIILVDTKYEFGDYKGELTLIDEVHTPDSSRFWIQDSYQERIDNNLEPENFDKEFFRLWYSKQGYFGDGKPPQMPRSFYNKVSDRYCQIYERITGQKFVKSKGSVAKRIMTNMSKYLDQVVIIAGSESDKEFVTKIEKSLIEVKLKSSTYYASAHKNPLKVLETINCYQEFKKKVVFITVAGKSNALSGFVAANCDFPVIACPPLKDKLDYLVNIHSTLQMPSKVPVMTVINPQNAVLAVKRILN